MRQILPTGAEMDIFVYDWWLADTPMSNKSLQYLTFSPRNLLFPDRRLFSDNRRLLLFKRSLLIFVRSLLLTTRSLPF